MKRSLDKFNVIMIFIFRLDEKSCKGDKNFRFTIVGETKILFSG